MRRFLLTVPNFANKMVGNRFVGKTAVLKLQKAGSNWVEGDRFFNRASELQALEERVRDGAHTLLTAQRRMGKTSLVRELLRRLGDAGGFEPIFVDLEAAMDPADAIAEIGASSRSAQGAWHRIQSAFANALRTAGDQVETLSLGDLKAKLRGGMSAGDWRQKGDDLLAALAENDRPVVLALDELPILVNRLLKGQDEDITPEGRQAADAFLSWLRHNGQTHRDRICMILAGSVGLEPILRQAGLSAHANIFSSFDLKPWNEQTAKECLEALAANYGLDLPQEVRVAMCHRLRCQIPHHVQQFFDHLHEHLRRAGRNKASLEDVAIVYQRELLGPRGQMVLDHYENRLRLVLGRNGYPTALDMLTEASVNHGKLGNDAIALFHALAEGQAQSVPVKDVLYTLEHDGYLAPEEGGYRFVSGLLEDWWRARHGQHFVPIADRDVAAGPKR